MRFFLQAFFSFGGIGYFPFGQGTFASFLTCIIYYFSERYAIFYTPALFLTSIFLSVHIKKIWKDNDPPQVVIDEVLGMFISLFLIPANVKYISLAFFIFRFIDVLKVPPVNFIDRMNNHYAVIFDDVVAGIMTNIFLRTIDSIFLTR